MGKGGGGGEKFYNFSTKIHVTKHMNHKTPNGIIFISLSLLGFVYHLSQGRAHFLHSAIYSLH